jgi:hypothetical protein
VATPHAFHFTGKSGALLDGSALFSRRLAHETPTQTSGKVKKPAKIVKNPQHRPCVPKEKKTSQWMKRAKLRAKFSRSRFE